VAAAEGVMAVTAEAKGAGGGHWKNLLGHWFMGNVGNGSTETASGNVDLEGRMCGG
jgi:hypothetical protein